MVIPILNIMLLHFEKSEDSLFAAALEEQYSSPASLLLFYSFSYYSIGLDFSKPTLIRILKHVDPPSNPASKSRGGKDDK